MLLSYQVNLEFLPKKMFPVNRDAWHKLVWFNITISEWVTKLHALSSQVHVRTCMFLHKAGAATPSQWGVEANLWLIAPHRLKVSVNCLNYSKHDDGDDIPYIFCVLVYHTVTAELGGTSCVEHRRFCPKLQVETDMMWLGGSNSLSDYLPVYLSMWS